MPTYCSRDLFGYEGVEGRQIVAAFDGGKVTSDAGALLLGAIGRSVWSDGSPPASPMVAPRRRSSTRSGPWWRSGCSASRLAMRI